MLEVVGLAVELAERLGRVVAVEGVGAQGAAQPAHDHGRLEPVPGDVAHHDAEPVARQREQVVPVAAEPGLRAGHVPGGEAETGQFGQPVRQQAALQGHRGGAVLLEGLHLDRHGEAVGEQLQGADLGLGEPARPHGSDVQDADQLAAGDHRHAEHGVQAAFPQQGVHDGGLVDVVEGDGRAVLGHPPGEPGADRHAHALVDLFLDARGRDRHELLPARLVAQHGRGVDLQHLADAVQGRGEQLGQAEVVEAGAPMIVSSSCSRSWASRLRDMDRP